MQNKKTILQLVLCVFIFGCENKNFSELIAQSRGSLIDQVNEPKEGLPFYTTGTLNPIWEQKDIVRMPALDLLNQKNEKTHPEMFKNKISFVGFFFASCRGFCTVLVRNLKKIEKQLGGGAQYVALTVDPEHDTPKVLERYAKDNELSDKHWSLLTGDKEKIYSLARSTFVNQAFRRPSSESERNFVHSEHIYVIDQQGRLRAVLNGTRTDLVEAATKVAAELH